MYAVTAVLLHKQVVVGGGQFIRRVCSTRRHIAGAHGRQEQGQRSLSFLVKILLDEQDELSIRSGMSVRADIYSETNDKALAVPVQAVLIDEDAAEGEEDQDEQAYVYVMEDGTAVRKDVKTGLSSDSDQEILEGLEEGEHVIAGPYRVLRHLNEGDEVEEEDESEEDQDKANDGDDKD